MSEIKTVEVVCDDANCTTPDEVKHYGEVSGQHTHTRPAVLKLHVTDETRTADKFGGF